MFFIRIHFVLWLSSCQWFLAKLLAFSILASRADSTLYELSSLDDTHLLIIISRRFLQMLRVMHRSDKFSWLKSTCTVCLPSGRSHLTSHVGKLARPHGILVHTGKSPLLPLFPERYLCLALPSPQWNKCTLEALKCTWSQYGRSCGFFPVTFYAVFLIFYHQIGEVVLVKLRTVTWAIGEIR